MQPEIDDGKFNHIGEKIELKIESMDEDNVDKEISDIGKDKFNKLPINLMEFILMQNVKC